MPIICQCMLWLKLKSYKCTLQTKFDGNPMTWSDWELPFLSEGWYTLTTVQRTTYVSTNQINMFSNFVNYMLKKLEQFLIIFKSEKIVLHNADYKFWVYLWHNFEIRYVPILPRKFFLTKFSGEKYLLIIFPNTLLS